MKNLICILFFKWTLAYSQTPSIEWAKCYGGSKGDYGQNVFFTTDSGFLLTGYTYSNDSQVTGNHASSGYADYWIVKTDSLGNIEWQKCLGGTNDDQAFSGVQTFDGGYIIAGNSKSNDGDVTGSHGGADYWVVKLDAVGTMQWQKAYGGGGDDFAYSIEQTFDSGFVVAGRTGSGDGDVTNNNGFEDYWIVKIDSIGNIEWQKSYGGTQNDGAYSIKQTTDSGYVVAGSAASNDSDVTGSNGGEDYWILKLTPVGDMQWQKTFGGSSQEKCHSIRQTVDGGYILGGYSSSNNGDVTSNYGYDDYWLVKITSSGNLEWQKNFGGSGEDYGRGVIQTLDGGFEMIAEITSGDLDASCNQHLGTAEYFLVKTNNNGVLEWQKCMGGSFGDFCRGFVETITGPAILGYSGSHDGDVTGNHLNQDYWLIKLTMTGSGITDEKESGFSAYPNPFSGTLNIFFEYAEGKIQFDIFNCFGEKVFTKDSMEKNVEIDLSFLRNGIYILCCQNNGKVFNRKLVKLQDNK